MPWYPNLDPFTAVSHRCGLLLASLLLSFSRSSSELQFLTRRAPKLLQRRTITEGENSPLPSLSLSFPFRSHSHSMNVIWYISSSHLCCLSLSSVSSNVTGGAASVNYPHSPRTRVLSSINSRIDSSKMCIAAILMSVRPTGRTV